jgi:hypothetical protein
VFTEEFFIAWLTVCGQRVMFGDGEMRDCAREMYREHVQRNPVDGRDVDRMIKLVESIMFESSP